LLGARFLVCDECTAAELEGYSDYSEVWSLGSLKLLENQSAKSYLSTPRYVTLFPEGVTNFPNELQRSDAPNETVFIQSKDVEASTTISTNCDILKKREFGFQYFDLRAECKGKAVLVVNSFNDGNWKAKINGTLATPYLVNGMLVGLTLEAGSNNVQVFNEPILRNNLFRLGGFFMIAYLIMGLLIINSKRIKILLVRP
jgi:hypothetical protein